MGLIQFHRGLEAGLPTLEDGEPGFTTDTFRLWVGYAGVNHEITGVIHDGDYLDIDVAASGAEWTIKPGAVTYAKIQDVSAASKLLGRGAAAGAGAVQEISIGSGLSMTGTTLSATGGSSGGALADGDYGDIIVSGTSTVFTIDTAAVTYAKMQAVSAASRLLGRGTAGGTAVREIDLGAGLAMSGNQLACTVSSGSDWDSIAEQAIDQDVTASGTFVDSTDLTLAVTAGDVWYCRVLLLYAGNNVSGKFKYQVAFPTSAHGFLHALGADNVSDAAYDTMVRITTAATGQVVCGTDNALGTRVAEAFIMFRAGGTGTMSIQFANYSAGPGRTSRLVAGSKLYAKKLN